MREVLFVDDEKLIIDGLRRNLRSMRKEWNMSFAEGADEGLAQVANQPFDAIVSDLRMPGIDGAEFLARAKEAQPDSVRVVLSGHADMGLAARSARSAHSFLAKPCSMDDLRDLLERAFRLREQFANPNLRRFAQGARMPSIPALYNGLCELMSDPAATAEDAAALVERDVSMSAKVLQLVNSAFFGMGRNIDSITKAVVMLGLETLKSAVLTNELFESDAVLSARDVEVISDHSLSTARVARKLAVEFELDPLAREQAMTAAVVHDVGMLLLSQADPNPYEKLDPDADTSQTLALERELLGFSHQELGGYTLGLWGISDPVVEAACFHHEPAQAPSREMGPLAVLHMADYVVDASNGKHASLDTEYLDGLGGEALFQPVLDSAVEQLNAEGKD